MSSVPNLDEFALASINEQQASNNDAWIKVLDARKKKKKLDERAIEEELATMKESMDAKKGELANIKKELKALEAGQLLRNWIAVCVPAPSTAQLVCGN